MKSYALPLLVVDRLLQISRYTGRLRDILKKTNQCTHRNKEQPQGKRLNNLSRMKENSPHNWVHTSEDVVQYWQSPLLGRLRHSASFH